MCQTSIVFVHARKNMANACSMATVCTTTRVFRFGNMSASTPPTSENSVNGSVCRSATTPSEIGESVSRSTSQLCATVCVHPPTCETICPKKKTL